MALDEVRSGMGSLGLWGHTPACNLLDLINHFDKTCNAQELTERHVLLMGQSDLRHILKTLSNYPTPETVPEGKDIHIYMVDSCPILYARQLLLMHLALLPTEKIGLYEKTIQFMEIFGNTLIRPQTRKTISKCCETLIKVLTDETFKNEILPMLNLDGLKHRERDMIVEVLRFWTESKMSSDDIRNLWDTRLRQCLLSRYDTRIGAFDWDYQMRVTEKNPDTKIINVKEYKNWRNSGLAFTEYENDYNQANVTFLSGKGTTFQGDTLIGPFIPYGIKSEDESFFEKENHEFKKKSQDLTFHTLRSYLSVLSSYQNSKMHVHFLPFDTSTNLWKKSKFLEKFDLIHVSNFIGHQISPELTNLMSSKGVCVVEKTKYVWYFRIDNEKAYQHKVLELANSAGLRLIKDSSTDFLAFKKMEHSADKPSISGEDEASSSQIACEELEVEVATEKSEPFDGESGQGDHVHEELVANPQ